MVNKKMTLEEKLGEAIVEDVPYEVPDNWVWSSFGSVIKLISGRDVSGKLCNEEKKGIPYILGASNIKDGKFIAERWIENPVVVAEENDILISCKGTIGKTIIAKDKINISRQIMAIRCDNNIELKYIKFFIDSYVNTLIDQSKGLIPGITREDILNIKVPIPPLKEQQRIVDKIESLFEKLDKAKELIEEARDDFEKRKSAILGKAFRGELTKEWRSINKNKILDKTELFNQIKEVRFSVITSNKERKEIESIFNDYKYIDQTLPNGWIKLKSSMVCELISCGKTPTASIVDKGEVAYLKVYNIVNNKIDFEYKPQFIDYETHSTKLKSSMLRPNDVIMNIVGPPLKKIAIIPETYKDWNMNQALVRFRTTDCIDYRYFYYCLLYDNTLRDVINATRGVVGQANISVSQSRNLDIIVASLEEQKEIVRILDKLLEEEAKIEELTKLEEQIELIKKSILAKAFRGQLGTNCPEEESALELLKEILSKE